MALLGTDLDFSEVSALRVAWLWHFREPEQLANSVTIGRAYIEVIGRKRESSA